MDIFYAHFLVECIFYKIMVKLKENFIQFYYVNRRQVYDELFFKLNFSIDFIDKFDRTIS